ncbi:flagellar hook-associated protein FlgK [Pseudomonas sp.]|uniref:flagellar hook-associated protein FlgK n=1 Tax=Pseudomonas sp. TaxID=306 RepID=UPI001A021F38|nr:flagellar hook-associated protein FlgK [Pseudomonas sp.]MBF0676722.1 flagellar hook-associated protein FlgK [Pseudomonas sp.]
MSLMSQIGMSGVRASQTALTTTSQNVANVNTPGFSRLRTEQMSLSGHTTLSGGRGVEITTIRRIADDYVNRQLWRSTSEQGINSSRQQYLVALEQMMASEGSNISGGLDDLYAALNATTSTPDSIALRQQILNEAGALTQRFNGLSNNIELQLKAVRGQREAMVTELNGLTGNIAELNKRIGYADATNGDSKALRDQRDSLVQSLAELADIRVGEAADGSFSISLANGQPLVAGATAATVSLSAGADNEQDFKLSFAGTEFPMARDGWGGKLGGLHDAEYNSLRSIQGSINQMAGELATQFNTVLASGTDLDGNPGKPLFVYDPTSISQVLTVASLSPRELAFSVSGANAAQGNNETLLELIQLKNATVTVDGNTSTLNDAYASLLGKVASQSRQGQADLETATSVLAQVQAQRDSISAVSLDEEGVNLMNFQQAYQANLKVISTARDLFDSMLAVF